MLGVLWYARFRATKIGSWFRDGRGIAPELQQMLLQKHAVGDEVNITKIGAWLGERGEYAMIKAAAERGWLDESSAMMESLIAIKRAGANFIISYFSKSFAQYSKNSSTSA